MAAVDPVSLVLGIVSRVIDTKKPASKTNVATGGAVGIGSAAYMLIESGDPTMVAVGWGLGLVGAALALYKEKESK